MTSSVLLMVALSCYLAIRCVQAAGITWTHAAVNSQWRGSNYQCGLYINNITPTPTTPFSSFTELSESGYAQITLLAGSWTLTDDSTGTNGDYPNITFTWTTTSGVTVYGYFVIDGSNNVIGAESFSGGGYPFTAGPSALTLTPGVRAQGQ